MAYIVVVNPQILGAAGMDFGAVMVATILAAAFSTACLGLLANYPFALATGMGLNAYIAYGIVLQAGIPWETALGICFFAGLLFLLLTLCGFRSLLMHAIPPSLRAATVGGIGLLLAFIALKNGGVIEADAATLVRVGDLRTGPCLLTLLGTLLIGGLLAKRVPGAFLWVIALNTLLGSLLGLVHWQGIWAMPPSLAPTWLKLDLMGALAPRAWPLLVTLVFVALLDAAATILGLAHLGGFVKGKEPLPRGKRTLIADGLGSMVAAALGTTTQIVFLESAAGIAAGGRTGVTAIGIAVLFLCTLFFAPLISAIPLFATAPVLLIIGALMLKGIKEIAWDDLTEAIPAFLVLATIPLTFSLATGIAVGFIAYPFLKLATGKTGEVHWLVWVLAGLFCLRFFW